ncbi:hypothetical protein F4778DRAFT_707185 [Xylariomycetidae sp. FL2044]|nr:hypothetical protein F4778DRAFT_707185 [Xylariomycetidae sp. FL2044]
MSKGQVPSTPKAPELITVIITTSPTPSAPSTELISAILSGFRIYCGELLDCRIIVVFDTFNCIGPRLRLKKGQVTADDAEVWEAYKSNFKEFLLAEVYGGYPDQTFVETQGEAEFGMKKDIVPFTITQTEDKRITFIEPARRIGFGLAVRTALRQTETPYVWVQQHDWPLVAPIPLQSILEVMQASQGDQVAPVKYVCVPSVRMLEYAASAHVAEFPVLKGLTAQLKRTFHPPSSPDVAIPLTPLFFWHDKPHIASTAHYLTRVFPSPLAMRRGEFIEDTVGQRARDQMKEGAFAKWACWLYYPDEGKLLCLRHLDGRRWRGAENELQKKADWLATNNVMAAGPRN